MDPRYYKPLNRVERSISYVVLAFTALACIIFFCLLNRTHVHGWLNFSRRKPVLLLPNHTTMIDSFLVEVFAGFPWALVRPGMLAYHPAAAENFFSHPVLAWFSRMWRCIPVNHTRKDPTAMRLMATVLATNPLVVFPAGTRSRDGSVGRGRPGVGRLILDTQPVVVPVYIAGMGAVLPIGKRVPRLFKRLDIYFACPIDFSAHECSSNDRDTSRKIIDRVMDEICRMQEAHLARRPAAPCSPRPSFSLARLRRFGGRGE